MSSPTSLTILASLITGILMSTSQVLSYKVHKELLCPVGFPTPEGFHYTPFQNGSGSLGFIGDVNDVLNGIVTPGTQNNFWNGVNTGRFGFGAATNSPSLEGLGEAVFVNGNAAVRSTDNGTSEYFQTVVGTEFRTSFAVFVSHDANPDAIAEFYTMDNSRNISLLEFYTRVHERVGHQPFCYLGLTQFSQLDGIAISKAPIYNEPLFGNIAEGYYSQPNFQIPHAYGMTFGCAANFSTITDSELATTLRKLLYVNPLDAGSSTALQVHSHGLTTRRCLQNVEAIDTSSILDVYHLLSNSTFSYINAKVFVLNRRDKLLELSHPSGEVEGSLKQNGASGTSVISMIPIVSMVLFVRVFL